MAEKLHRTPVKLFLFGGAAVIAIVGALGWLRWPEAPAPGPAETSIVLGEAELQPPMVAAFTSPAVSTEIPTGEPEAKGTLSTSPSSPAATWIGKSAEGLTSPQLPLSRGVSGWEAQVDSILGENVPEHTKAERLLQRLPFLPEEAYARATEEAVRRLRDRDYPRLIRPLIMQPATHGAIMSVLFADLLERPDEIAIPTLADIADQPEHPFRTSAEDDLDLLVDKKKPGWAERIAQMRAALEYKPGQIVE